MKNLYFGQLFSTFILEIFTDFFPTLDLSFSTFVQFFDFLKKIIIYFGPIIFKFPLVFIK